MAISTAEFGVVPPNCTLIGGESAARLGALVGAAAPGDVVVADAAGVAGAATGLAGGAAAGAQAASHAARPVARMQTHRVSTREMRMPIPTLPHLGEMSTRRLCAGTMSEANSYQSEKPRWRPSRLSGPERSSSRVGGSRGRPRVRAGRTRG